MLHSRHSPWPALAVLAAILVLAMLLAPTAQSPDAKAGGTGDLPDPLEAGWKGKPVCEKLHEDELQRVLRCTFPPGVGHERHYHPRHFGYALSGGLMQITDSNGTRESDLAAGSYFHSDGVKWHEGLNIGDTTIAYLIVEPK